MEQIKEIIFKKKSDNRGNLIPIESCKDIPFVIERVFFVKNMDELPRGFHVHKKSKEIILPINGSFELELTDGITTNHYFLNSDTRGIYIPPNVWLKFYNFSNDCIICAICSHEYDHDEYIADYDEFIEYRKKIKENKIFNFSLNEQTQSIKHKIHYKLNKLIDRNDYVMGKELKEFELNYAKYNQSKYCVGLSNGTTALMCALEALHLEAGDEVIIQSNTYVAAPLAIQICNLKIKVVDIDDNLNIDLDELEKNITKKTKAVIVVHLYGMCPDMDRLMDLKKKHGFYLIEDAAQAHGSTYKNKKLGTFGDIGCFSFYPSKNLGSFGEGGCIITDNEEYYNFILKHRNYGSIVKNCWEIKGNNHRMHNIQAAVLDVKLEYLDVWNSQRHQLANIYDRELKNIEQIRLIKNNEHLYRTYHVYAIMIDERDELKNFLEKNNIDCNIHYPETFYKSKAFSELNHLEFKADKTKNMILSLPMYPELSSESVMRVCDKIKEFFIK